MKPAPKKKPAATKTSDAKLVLVMHALTIMLESHCGLTEQEGRRFRDVVLPAILDA